MLSMLAQASIAAPPVILVLGEKRKERPKFTVFILYHRVKSEGQNSLFLFVFCERTPNALWPYFLPQYQDTKHISM